MVRIHEWKHMLHYNLLMNVYLCVCAVSHRLLSEVFLVRCKLASIDIAREDWENAAHSLHSAQLALLRMSAAAIRDGSREGWFLCPVTSHIVGAEELLQPGRAGERRGDAESELEESVCNEREVHRILVQDGGVASGATSATAAAAGALAGDSIDLGPLYFPESLGLQASWTHHTQSLFWLADIFEHLECPALVCFCVSLRTCVSAYVCNESRSCCDCDRDVWYPRILFVM